jgi:hypothetical protein
LNKRMEALKREVAALENQRSELHDKRWRLTMTTLVGQKVAPSLNSDEDTVAKHRLLNEVGILKELLPNDRCLVDFGVNGEHTFDLLGVQAADEKLWSQVFHFES